MAPAKTDLNISACELTIRLQLRKSGMRLERSGLHYQIFYKNHVLLAGNAQGDALALEEVAAFLERSLVR